MAEAAKTDKKMVIHFRCSVSALAPQVAVEFEDQFCQALAGNLSRDLDATFHLTSGTNWHGEGRALAVDIRMTSMNRASVTISTGQLREGTFTANSTTDTSLTSFDRPLTPAASRTLVRGIGLQMGLIR